MHCLPADMTVASFLFPKLSDYSFKYSMLRWMYLMPYVKSFLVSKPVSCFWHPSTCPEPLCPLALSYSPSSLLLTPRSRLCFRGWSESRLRDQGEAMLLLKQSTPINSSHFALCLSPRLSHSSAQDLLSSPLDLCLFCQHPLLLIHTTYREWCSYLTTSPMARSVSVPIYILISLNVFTSISIMILLPLLWRKWIWVQNPE